MDISKSDNLKFILEQFKEIEKDDLEYIYRGNITPILVRNILDLARTNLEKAEDTQKLKSRIYYIMGEGLQNITRHQDAIVESGENSAIFVIHKRRLKYYIASGNLILNQNIPNLKLKLEKINHLDPEELKDFARYTRLNVGLSEKGGASLGLIEMARRSGNKLEFDFKYIDEQFSYFYINTEIPTGDNEGTEMQTNEIYDYPLESLKNFHTLLNRENFVLVFKGDFNQDNLLNLLTIVKGQMQESTTSIKVYNVMVEMLQNIVKHSDNRNEINNWKPGIFFINDTQDAFVLTAGNYIENSKIETFKNKLEFVNSLSAEELPSFYNKVLLNFEVEDRVKTGLGIIDMRRKSAQKLKFNFTPVNDNFSFFTMQAEIHKKK